MADIIQQAANEAGIEIGHNNYPLDSKHRGAKYWAAFINAIRNIHNELFEQLSKRGEQLREALNQNSTLLREALDRNSTLLRENTALLNRWAESDPVGCKAYFDELKEQAKRDEKKAYYFKAIQTHPDLGGSCEAFKEATGIKHE